MYVCMHISYVCVYLIYNILNTYSHIYLTRTKTTFAGIEAKTQMQTAIQMRYTWMEFIVYITPTQ